MAELRRGSPRDGSFDQLRRAQTIARTEAAYAYATQAPSKVFFEYERVEFDPLLGPNGK